MRALTIKENLFLAQQLAGLKSNAGRVEDLLNRLGIQHKGDNRPQALSQGELQRAAIARALINQPVVILADEPTSALDDTNCNEVVKLFEQEAKLAGAMLLIVTHDGRLKDEFENSIILKK